MEGSEIGIVRLLGMRYVTGGGVLVFPVNPDSLEIGRLSVDIHFGFEKGFNLMFHRFGLCWLE